MEGFFVPHPDRLKTRLRECPPPRQEWLLNLVQAAVTCGATSIEVTTDPSVTRVAFDGDLDPDELEHLWAGLWAPGTSRREFRLQQLAFGVAGALAAGAGSVQVDRWEFRSLGSLPAPAEPPAPGTHALVVRAPSGWFRSLFARLDVPPGLVKESTGFGFPEIRLDGETVWSGSCEGFPSFRFTNSTDPAVRLDDMLRREHVEVSLDPPPALEVSVFVALSRADRGWVRLVCAGVQVGRWTDLSDLPGVAAQVTVPVLSRDPIDPAPWLALVRRVWLQGLRQVQPEMRVDRLIPALRWFLRQMDQLPEADAEVRDHLTRVPLVDTAEGVWSLERCRARKPVLPDRSWDLESLLDSGGVDYCFQGDLEVGSGVTPSERKSAVAVDFLEAKLDQNPAVLPFGWREQPPGRLEVDVLARTATLVSGGVRDTLSIQRILVDEEEQQGDLKTITTFYLLLGDGRRSFVVSDVEKHYYESLDEPTGRWGVGARVHRLADSLR